jgi:hypothetical protein
MPLAPDLEAFQHFLTRSAVPIFYDLDGDEAEARGTGTFLDLGDRLLLVTAAHVFEGCDPNKFSCPWTRAGRLSKATTFGPGGVWSSPSSGGCDVAVAEIEHEDAAAAFRKYYRCLSLDRIAMPTLGKTHILAGFPRELTTPNGNRIDQTPFIYYSEMLAEAPAGVKNLESWDLFFTLEREGHVLSGAPGDTPNLGGVSGCMIWERAGCEGPLWTPQTTLRAIGVQTSAKPDAYFRATCWLPIIPLIAHFDRRAAAELAVSLMGEEHALERIREVWPEGGVKLVE